jgi:hypothetical protein
MVKTTLSLAKCNPGKKTHDLNSQKNNGEQIDIDMTKPSELELQFIIKVLALSLPNYGLRVCMDGGLGSSSGNRSSSNSRIGSHRQSGAAGTGRRQPGSRGTRSGDVGL